VLTLADSPYLYGAGAFVPLLNLEFNPVAFVQRLKAVSDDTGIVDKKIRSVIMRKKSKTFLFVEPFDCSFSHKKLLLK